MVCVKTYMLFSGIRVCQCELYTASIYWVSTWCLCDTV